MREIRKFQATLRFSLSPIRGIEVSFTNTGEAGRREGTNWKWKLNYLGQTSCRDETESRELLRLAILSWEILDKSHCPLEKLKPPRKESGKGSEGPGPKLRSTCIGGMAKGMKFMVWSRTKKGSRVCSSRLQESTRVWQVGRADLIGFSVLEPEPRALGLPSKSSSIELLPQWTSCWDS